MPTSGFFMLIYLDESGDLGWQLELPHNNGGSSQYLVLTFLFLPDDLHNEPQDVISNLYRIHRWVREKKCSGATLTQKIRFCGSVVALLQNHPEIKIDAIVVKKANVLSHIRSDGNKLYNYMCGLVIPNYARKEKEVCFMPDIRSIKVKSGNSLAEYLQIKLWFDCKAATKIVSNPCESYKNYNIQFVDWVAHCVWTHFENSISKPFRILEPHIRVRRLYFNS
jgi:hypothetical protein